MHILQKYMYIRDQPDALLIEERDEQGILLYQGGYDLSTHEKRGFGMLYNNGVASVFGEFDHNNLRVIHKSFSGRIMIELDEDGLISYKGEYLDDFLLHFPREGQGQEFCENNLIFKGNFADGKRNGYGVSYYENGVESFRGEWKDNLPLSGQHFSPEGIGDSMESGIFLISQKNLSVLNMMSVTIRSLVIDDRSCNDDELNEIVLSNLPNLHDISIGSGCVR